MEVLYRLGDDTPRLEAMRRRSVESDEGLAPDHGTIGSEEWWSNVRRGVVRSQDVDGVVVRVFWGSMNDYAMFALRGADGAETEWTRQGDITRYAVGARARVTYVVAQWKPKTAQQILAETTELVVEIAVEDIGERSSSIAPGPGGIGYRLRVLGRCREQPLSVALLVASEHPGDRQHLTSAILGLVADGELVARSHTGEGLSTAEVSALLDADQAAAVRLDADRSTR
jgi:hypothetical protein